MMPPSFLQSSEWESFEAALGRATWRVHGALVIQRDVLFGLHYLYCPRPIALTANFFSSMRKIAAAERSVFLKIDPAEEFSIPGARPSRAIQPAETIVLDLADRTEDELLAAMHEKTRYNIRLAERRGVRIKNQESRIKNGSFETFWKLLQETATRDGFRTHAKEYYEKMLAVQSGRFSNELFFAEYGGEVLAAAIINFYRGETPIERMATYLHGASAPRHREIMAPHLLQWRIIQEARKRGCAQYDFWGIDEQRWPGVTRFKRGFAGREIAYPRSMDIVYRPAWYALYALAKRGKM